MCNWNSTINLDFLIPNGTASDYMATKIDGWRRIGEPQA